MTGTIEETIRNLGVPGYRPARRDIEALAEYLVADPHFADCTYADLEALVRAGSIVTVPATWVFLQEGAPAHALYILLTGSAEVFHDRQSIAKVGPGDILGEIALLHRVERTATVTSSEPVRALRVEFGQLANVLEQHPRLRKVITGVGKARTVPAA